MEVAWDLTPGNERIPSTATQGNILEAINITLNLLHLHYIDRDLHRTGNSIVIITAGNGVFEIEKNLAGKINQGCHIILTVSSSSTQRFFFL